MNIRLMCNISCLLARHLPHNSKSLATIYQCSKMTFAHSTQQKEDNHYQHSKGNKNAKFLPVAGLFCASSAFIFNWFKSNSSEETENAQDALLNMIKRSLLCIQREQYDKAEQMLHLALRMAQDLQSNEGITYIYDVMANMAMERKQYKKAEKLFTDVMKRLMSQGFSEDSIQMLYISTKLAHMAQLQGDFDKAMQGFKWSLTKIDNLLKQAPKDENLVKLFGLAKNWY